MMISVEEYRRQHLEGKAYSQIQYRIRLLQKEIKHLAEVIANPDKYMGEHLVTPSPQTRLSMNMAYLECAMNELPTVPRKPHKDKKWKY